VQQGQQQYTLISQQLNFGCQCWQRQISFWESEIIFWLGTLSSLLVYKLIVPSNHHSRWYLTLSTGLLFRMGIISSQIVKSANDTSKTHYYHQNQHYHSRVPLLACDRWEKKLIEIQGRGSTRKSLTLILVLLFLRLCCDCGCDCILVLSSPACQDIINRRYLAVDMIHSNEECDAITPETTDTKIVVIFISWWCAHTITIEADEAIDKIVVIYIQISHNLLQRDSSFVFFGGGKRKTNSAKKSAAMNFLRQWVHN